VKLDGKIEESILEVEREIYNGTGISSARLV